MRAHPPDRQKEDLSDRGGLPWHLSPGGVEQEHLASTRAGRQWYGLGRELSEQETLMSEPRLELTSPKTADGRPAPPSTFYHLPTRCTMAVLACTYAASVAQMKVTAPRKYPTEMYDPANVARSCQSHSPGSERRCANRATPRQQPGGTISLTLSDRDVPQKHAMHHANVIIAYAAW